MDRCEPSMPEELDDETIARISAMAEHYVQVLFIPRISMN